jgi:hypothetical protein
VVVANTATHKQVNLSTPPKAVSKKNRHSKLTQKAMLPTLLNKRDQNMAPNSIGAFLFNTKEKKLKDPQAMITIFNRST